MNSEDINQLKLNSDISNFLYKEARFLDDQNFDGWLELLSDDVEYWIPASRDQKDPILEVSITYESKQLLELRVQRLSHPHAHSVNRMPRSSHLISNIFIDENRSENGDLIVSSNFLTIGFQEGADSSQTLYGGSQIHHLYSTDHGYRIRKKKIILNNAEAPHGNIQIIL